MKSLGRSEFSFALNEFEGVTKWTSEYFYSYLDVGC
jgi:hypothetical protein